MTFAPWVGDVKGKVGNAVVQGNRAGATLREKVIPNNPGSSAQTAVRTNTSAQSKAWAGLTDAQRNGWNTAAASDEWSMKNKLGQPFKLSGFQLFMQLNLVLLNIGQSAITDVPAKTTFSDIGMGALTVTATGSVATIAYTGDAVLGQQFIVRASGQVSAGVMSAKSVSFVDVYIGTGVSPLDFATEYVARFGALTAGRKVFVEFYQVSNTTGETLLVGSANAIVGA